MFVARKAANPATREQLFAAQEDRQGALDIILFQQAHGPFIRF